MMFFNARFCISNILLCLQRPISQLHSCEWSIIWKIITGWTPYTSTPFIIVARWIWNTINIVYTRNALSGVQQMETTYIYRIALLIFANQKFLKVLPASLVNTVWGRWANELSVGIYLKWHPMSDQWCQCLVLSVVMIDDNSSYEIKNVNLLWYRCPKFMLSVAEML